MARRTLSSTSVTARQESLSRRRFFRRAPLVAVLVIVACCTPAVAQQEVPESEAIAAAPSAPPDPPSEAPHTPPQLRVVLREGDTPDGGGGLPVSWLGSPVTHGANDVAFSGVLDNGATGDGFVWRNGAIVWRHSQVTPPRPTVASPAIGFGLDGQFVFRTLVDRLDTVWSHLGAVVTKNGPAPGIGDGATIQLSRRATMTAGGRAYWVSEFVDGPGQTGKGRVLYAADDAAPDKIQVVLRSDQMIGGLQVARPRGLDLNFGISPDGTHLIQPIELTAKEISDQALYVDGAIALREGEPATSSTTWGTFRQVAINDHGNYLFSAETMTPPGALNLVIGYNGEVAVREGDPLDGQALTPPAAVLALAIDNRGRAAHLWSLAGFGIEALFFACDASDLKRSTLLMTASSGNLGADPIAIDRFEHVGHSRAISFSAESDKLYAAVSIEGEGGPEHAILEVKLPSCPGDPIVAAAGEGAAEAVSAKAEETGESPAAEKPVADG